LLKGPVKDAGLRDWPESPKTDKGKIRREKMKKNANTETIKRGNKKTLKPKRPRRVWVSGEEMCRRRRAAWGTGGTRPFHKKR